MAMLTLKASGTFIRVSADGYAVAAVSQQLPDPEAYARVFAAAPDLLVALKELRAVCPLGTAKVAAALEAAGAAIAKAEGA